MTYDVFISYAYLDYKDARGREVDGNIISRLTRAFDEAAITYWIDRQGLSGGDRFSVVIAEQIKNAKVFLFVSTKLSNQSEWTHNEVALARQLGKKIIPFRADDTFTAIFTYLCCRDLHLSPEELLDRADSLCTVTQFPKQLVTRGESKRVVNLYRKAAEGCERVANDAVRDYDPQLYYEDLHDAWSYFHDAGYAWQCVEEYEKSILAYTRSIYYAQLVVRQFPDKHKD